LKPVSVNLATVLHRPLRATASTRGMPFAPGPVSSNAGGAMKPNRSLLASVLLACFSTGAAWSQNEGNQANCSGLPTAGQLKQFLATAPNDGGDAGGLFNGTLKWAGVVNRSGQR